MVAQNLSHVTFAMLCIICVVPSLGFLRSMVPGLLILCHRNDWLPIDHLYMPKCSMVVGSLLEALRKKAHFGFVLLPVVFTNVFCMCLLCKGVHEQAKSETKANTAHWTIG